MKPEQGIDATKSISCNADDGNGEKCEVKPRRCTCAFIASSINITPKHPVVNYTDLQMKKNINEII